MSLNQAKQFYGFLEDVFVEKLGKRVETTLRERLSSAFDFPISDQNFAQMRDVLKRDTAKAELTQVINFMTGIDSQLQSFIYLFIYFVYFKEEKLKSKINK